MAGDASASGEISNVDRAMSAIGSPRPVSNQSTTIGPSSVRITLLGCRSPWQRTVDPLAGWAASTSAATDPHDRSGGAHLAPDAVGQRRNRRWGNEGGQLPVHLGERGGVRRYRCGILDDRIPHHRAAGASKDAGDATVGVDEAEELGDRRSGESDGGAVLGFVADPRFCGVRQRHLGDGVGAQLTHGRATAVGHHRPNRRCHVTDPTSGGISDSSTARRRAWRSAGLRCRHAPRRSRLRHRVGGRESTPTSPLLPLIG